VLHKLKAGVLDLIGIEREDVERLGHGQERNLRADSMRETHAVFHGPP
jgi:hypothetical protein